jgi:hypothetical protein
VFVAILVVAGFVLAVHAVLSIVDALKYSSDRGLTKALDEAMDRRAKALSEAAASGHLPPQLAPRLPDWSLP